MSGGPGRVEPTGDRVAVSVLTPVLDEEDGIGATVAAMRAQDLDGGFELLFVDGGSTDGTRAILDELAAEDPRVRVLDNPARRVPQALNIGLRAAGGAYVARMDAHTLYPRDYLRRGIGLLERGDVDWASGPQLAHGVGRWSRRVERALRSPLGVGGATFRTAEEEIEVDSGFTGVWRRETLEAHGGWDEDWPVNQDAELAARIRAAGGRIVCVPEMGARYVPRDSLAALARQYWRYGRYRAKTSRRHPESMRRSHVLAPGLVLTLLAAALPLGRLTTAARAGALVYAAAVLAESVRGAGTPRGREAPALAAVLATMHLPWGLGFLVGCARFGPPLRALGQLARSPSAPSAPRPVRFFRGVRRGTEDGGVRPGQQAPDFAAPDQDGERVRLSELRGRPVVLYFYPEASTPGCTVQACGVRDRSPDYERARAVVLGVSPDEPPKLRRFADEHDLRFTLVSDPGAEIAAAYGALARRPRLPWRTRAVKRSTFVIGPDGLVTHVFAEVDPTGHDEQVLEALEAS